MLSLRRRLFLGVFFVFVASLVIFGSVGWFVFHILTALLGADRAPCPHGCDRALDFAIMTAPDKRDPALLAKLDAVAGRVLNR